MGNPTELTNQELVEQITYLTHEQFQLCEKLSKLKMELGRIQREILRRLDKEEE